MIVNSVNNLVIYGKPSPSYFDLVAVPAFLVIDLIPPTRANMATALIV